MTPERKARIFHLIEAAKDEREMIGLRWGFQQQDEWTSCVQEHFARVAADRGYALLRTQDRMREKGVS